MYFWRSEVVTNRAPLLEESWEKRPGLRRNPGASDSKRRRVRGKASAGLAAVLMVADQDINTNSVTMARSVGGVR
jgi:hypothetical protein